MMSSSGVAHSKKRGATVLVDTTGIASKAEGARSGVVGRLASLMSEGGEGKGRAATEEHEDTSSAGMGQRGGKSMATGNGPQPNLEQETPPSSAPPAATAAAATAAAASNLKKVNHTERRFAEYQLASRGRPNLRGGGSRGGGWGRTGLGDEWLQDYLKAPRRTELEEKVYYEDELCVVIYDGFPKAQYHLLLIAKDFRVTHLNGLRMEHLPSRRRLHDVGRAIAEELCRQGAGQVRCGYHAIPSVEPLHVHIVSQDFDSPDMFKKSQWNGFTTAFFVDCSWVEARLEKRGKLMLCHKNYRKLQVQPPQCFRCGWAARVESLKKHNLECAAPLPEGATESRGKST